MFRGTPCMFLVKIMSLPYYLVGEYQGASCEKLEVPVVSKQGCEWCNKGYSGRQVIHEILENNFFNDVW